MSDTEAAILERMIRPEGVDMSDDALRAVLRIDFNESDHARMAELSRKAQEGQLAEVEREELEGYINVSHLVALLQSKARRWLRDPGPNASAA